MSIVRCRCIWLGRDVLGLEPLPRLGLERRELALELAPCRLSSTAREEHRREVVADVDEQAAERGRDAGVRRHEHGRDRELLGERRSVQRARAPEDDEGELARVVAAADRDQPHGVGHVRVRHLHDRVRGLVELEPRAADRRRTGRRCSAAARSSRIAPPISSSPSRPSTRFASVFVGSRVAAPVARRARDRRPPTAARSGATRPRRSRRATRRPRRW